MAEDGTRARDRVDRVFSLVVGTLGLVFLTTTGSSLFRQLDAGRWWWTVLAAPTLLGLFAVLAFGSFRLPVRRLRRTAAALAATYLVVLATIPAGFPRGAFPDDYLYAWPLLVGTVVVIGTPLAGGGRWVAAYLALFAPLFAAAFWWAASGGASSPFVLHWVLWIPLVGSLFASLSMRSQRAAGDIDADTERLRAAAAARARAEAVAQERSRVDALVHDTVLSALLVAGRGAADHHTRRAAAGHALRALASTPTTAHPRAENTTTIPARELAARLRQLCSDLDEPTGFDATVTDPDRPVTLAVARVLQEVAAEAVRNSLRHAHAAHRQVAVHVGGGTARVTVTDDGVGFDPAAAPGRSLGLTHSVRERVAQVSGAAVAVTSAPGHGTTIEVTAPVDAAVTGTGKEPGTGGGGEALPATSLTEVVGTRSAAAYALAFTFLAVEAAWPFEDLRPGMAGPGYAAALLALACGAVLLLSATADPLPRRRAAAVALAGIVASAASLAALPLPHDYRVNALWPWSAATILLCFLAIRGAVAAAWAGQLALLALHLGWLAAAGTTINHFPHLAQWQLLNLLGATLYAIVLRRQVRVMNTMRAQTVNLAAHHAEAQARLRERDAQLAYVRAAAWPLLERVHTDGCLDRDGQARALLVEARLRDRIRARALATEAVLDAAEAARSRGVEVALLDDGGLDGADNTLREDVTHTVRHHLAQAQAGTVTARVLPPGRAAVCTIVHTCGDTRVEIPAAHA